MAGLLRSHCCPSCQRLHRDAGGSRQTCARVWHRGAAVALADAADDIAGHSGTANDTGMTRDTCASEDLMNMKSFPSPESLRATADAAVATWRTLTDEMKARQA